VTDTWPVLTVVHEGVHDGDVDADAPVVERTAVRAVHTRDAAVLLLRTRRGHWKFPGGGVERGETLTGALQRELREECGLVDVDVGRRCVTVVELARAQEPGHLFRMTSHYYGCAGGTRSLPQDLTPAEHELGLAPEWLPPAQALRLMTVSGAAAPRWLERDLTVLRMLADHHWPA
jgi:ADP-ribose pyrophosphatase YjhB (NUDIX family)